MLIQKLKNYLIPKFAELKCRVEAHNNPEAVVVFALHVVKRPSKCSASITVESPKRTLRKADTPLQQTNLVERNE